MIKLYSIKFKLRRLKNEVIYSMSVDK